jgi:hypothetical protein
MYQLKLRVKKFGNSFLQKTLPLLEIFIWIFRSKALPFLQAVISLVSRLFGKD